MQFQYLQIEIKILLLMRKITKLSGASFEEIYLYQSKKTFVRKIFRKKKNNLQRALFFEQQYKWLEFAKEKNLSVPEILKTSSSKNKIFYDMKYIDKAKSLNQLKTFEKNQILKKVLSDLQKFYLENYKESVCDKNLLKNTFKTKIVNSIKSIKSENETLLESNYIIINQKKCKNIIKIFDEIIYSKKPLYNFIRNNFDQKFKTIIHGDLTFENILIKDKNYYLIDPYGGFADYKSKNNIFFKTSIFFDIGKICQSTVANYENWDEKKVYFSQSKKDLINWNIKFINEKSLKNVAFLEKNFNFLKLKNFDIISIIHMVVFLCRIIRYLNIKNKKLALVSYLVATYWINYIYN